MHSNMNPNIAFSLTGGKVSGDLSQLRGYNDKNARSTTVETAFEIDILNRGEDGSTRPGGLIIATRPNVALGCVAVMVVADNGTNVATGVTDGGNVVSLSFEDGKCGLGYSVLLSPNFSTDYTIVPTDYQNFIESAIIGVNYISGLSSSVVGSQLGHLPVDGGQAPSSFTQQADAILQKGFRCEIKYSTLTAETIEGLSYSVTTPKKFPRAKTALENPPALLAQIAESPHDVMVSGALEELTIVKHPSKNLINTDSNKFQPVGAYQVFNKQQFDTDAIKSTNINGETYYPFPLAVEESALSPVVGVAGYTIGAAQNIPSMYTGSVEVDVSAHLKTTAFETESQQSIIFAFFTFTLVATYANARITTTDKKSLVVKHYASQSALWISVPASVNGSPGDLQIPSLKFKIEKPDNSENPSAEPILLGVSLNVQIQTINGFCELSAGTTQRLETKLIFPDTNSDNAQGTTVVYSNQNVQHVMRVVENPELVLKDSQSLFKQAADRHTLSLSARQYLFDIMKLFFAGTETRVFKSYDFEAFCHYVSTGSPQLMQYISNTSDPAELALNTPMVEVLLNDTTGYQAGTLSRVLRAMTNAGANVMKRVGGNIATELCREAGVPVREWKSSSGLRGMEYRGINKPKIITYTATSVDCDDNTPEFTVTRAKLGSSKAIYAASSCQPETTDHKRRPSLVEGSGRWYPSRPYDMGITVSKLMPPEVARMCDQECARLASLDGTRSYDDLRIHKNILSAYVKQSGKWKVTETGDKKFIMRAVFRPSYSASSLPSRQPTRTTTQPSQAKPVHTEMVGRYRVRLIKSRCTEDGSQVLKHRKTKSTLSPAKYTASSSGDDFDVNDLSTGFDDETENEGDDEGDQDAALPAQPLPAPVTPEFKLRFTTATAKPLAAGDSKIMAAVERLPENVREIAKSMLVQGTNSDAAILAAAGVTAFPARMPAGDGSVQFLTSYIQNRGKRFNPPHTAVKPDVYTKSIDTKNAGAVPYEMNSVATTGDAFVNFSIGASQFVVVSKDQNNVATVKPVEVIVSAFPVISGDYISGIEGGVDFKLPARDYPRTQKYGTNSTSQATFEQRYVQKNVNVDKAFDGATAIKIYRMFDSLVKQGFMSGLCDIWVAILPNLPDGEDRKHNVYQNEVFTQGSCMLAILLAALGAPFCTASGEIPENITDYNSVMRIPITSVNDCAIKSVVTAQTARPFFCKFPQSELQVEGFAEKLWNSTIPVSTVGELFSLLHNQWATNLEVDLDLGDYNLSDVASLLDGAGKTVMKLIADFNGATARKEILSNAFAKAGGKLSRNEKGKIVISSASARLKNGYLLSLQFSQIMQAKNQAEQAGRKLTAGKVRKKNADRVLVPETKGGSMKKAKSEILAEAFKELQEWFPSITLVPVDTPITGIQAYVGQKGVGILRDVLKEELQKVRNREATFTSGVTQPLGNADKKFMRQLKAANPSGNVNNINSANMNKEQRALIFRSKGQDEGQTGKLLGSSIAGMKVQRKAFQALMVATHTKQVGAKLTVRPFTGDDAKAERRKARDPREKTSSLVPGDSFFLKQGKAQYDVADGKVKRFLYVVQFELTPMALDGKKATQGQYVVMPAAIRNAFTEVQVQGIDFEEVDLTPQAAPIQQNGSIADGVWEDEDDLEWDGDV